jgi:peptidoglycan/LPS O-acetylase OafA/YrhL
MTVSRYQGLDTLRVFASFGIVFFHVYVAAGMPNSLNALLKFRDFALPVMVLSSFFVLTLTVMRKAGGDFSSFFSRRIKRLWVPLMAWTFIYCLSEVFLFPTIFGAETFGDLPSMVVFLTGFRHLWFLQFIFVGSLAIYPLISRLSSEQKMSRLKLSGFCFLIASFYCLLFYSFLKNYTDWDTFSPESDISLRIFVSQASNYILYIPIAVGLALVSDKINQLFTHARFRYASLAVVLISLVIHLQTTDALLTKEFYGVAVFMAALQPWRKITLNGWDRLASYSYGIYILHFLPVQVLWLVVTYNNAELSGESVLATTIFIYSASFAVTVLIRKIFPAEWLLPLVPLEFKKVR